MDGAVWVVSISDPQPTKVVTLDGVALANYTNACSKRLSIANKEVIEHLRVIAVTECQRASTLVEEIVAKDVATALARDYLALAIALLEVAILDHALGLLVGHIACSEADTTLTIYAIARLIEHSIGA